jgi:rSAM/selenodomain-associated transferase 1
MTRIAIFAKAPVPGQVKTRLIPALGAEGAADLAARMLERTVEAARASGLAVELCGEPDPRQWYSGRKLTLRPQGPGGLGERLARAAQRILTGGEPILLVGADCPALTTDRLRTAAETLERHDCVIHPAFDGGYALLGLKRFDPSIFGGIAWSTPSAGADTIARIRALGWSLVIADTLRDIDEPEDLEAVGMQ